MIKDNRITFYRTFGITGIGTANLWLFDLDPHVFEIEYKTVRVTE